MGRELGSRRALARTLWVRAAVGSLAGAVPLVVLGGLYVREAALVYEGVSLFWLGVIDAGVLFLALVVFVRWRGNRALRRAAAWMDEDRSPTPAERELVEQIAVSYGWYPVAWWIAACAIAITTILIVGVGPQIGEIVVGAVGILLGGVVSCGLTFLLVEDAMRPVFRRAFVDGAGPVGRAVFGVRVRLVMYWFIGSGAYLVGIGLILLNFSPDVARPIGLACCLIGAFVGIGMTHLSSVSITGPLSRLGDGMHLVEAGNLTAAVAVDDVGMVGQLQAGFNRMVNGLRERDRLRELFGRHVGAEVAARALEQDAGLEGSELEATVMFVDVVGSTTLAAERPPAAVVGMLNAMFESVVDVVGRHGGLVNQFQGDGALCVFGAPIEVESHAERAVRAAIELRGAIDGFAATYPGFDAAIGVSTGRVVAGDVGTVDRYEYTVIGDAVNEASRLTEEAKGRQRRVLVSEATIVAAGDVGSSFVATGEVRLRGRPQVTFTYEPA